MRASKKDYDYKFKETEKLLNNYNIIKAKIENIKIELNNIDIEDLRAIDYSEDKISNTNAFNSSVENTIIKAEKEKERLEKELIHCCNTINKIDNALTTLKDIELKIIKMRYIDKNNNSWYNISKSVNLDKANCMSWRSKAINKISKIVFL